MPVPNCRKRKRSAAAEGGSNAEEKVRNSFKWTADLHKRMAEYLRDNYNSYKNSLNAGKKMSFLRGMRDDLGFECEDKQLKNGFTFFLKKYDEVKQKLNSSGFGVDPDKDKTLDKGWVLKICPYFEELDEVMACRPNVTPPAIVSTSTVNNISIHDGNVDEEIQDASGSINETSGVTEEQGEQIEDVRVDRSAASTTTASSSNAATSSVDPEISKYVKTAFEGLKTSKDTTTKSAIGIYSKIMSEKFEATARIEQDKLKLQERHYSAEFNVQIERNRIELLKVNQGLQLEEWKLNLEERKLNDKEAERQHEIVKIKMQQDFELKKLELLQNKNSNS